MTKLVIVESPNKIKKLEKVLGAGYKVMASVGHIRDLPETGMGVVAPYYHPEYVITRPDVVKRLKDAAKGADEVILASDPDREGEAIAFHLKEALRLTNPKRVAFNEITSSAVLAAMKKPRSIDDNLVHAQEARRVLDRLVGYRVSKSLSDTAGQKLSAGRVQTPALRLVVDRERDIQNFKVSSFYDVVADFENSGIKWRATWNYKPLLAAGFTTWTDRSFAVQVSSLREFKLSSIDSKEKPRSAPASFTTSTLQQAASIKLKMKPARTMELAQALFADGLITYHRTDSPNLSEEATNEIWDYLRNNNMSDYVPEKRNTWKSKEGAQEAHEAIRPTHFEDRNPEITDADAAKLYELIWLRAVACQMKAAIFDVTTIRLQSHQEVGGSLQEFVAAGRVPRFDGWMKLTADDATSEEKEEDIQTLPAIAENAALTAMDAQVLDKKTKAPARYSEASLVKELEAQGIGRPSTYASIMTTIFARGYVAEDKSRLVPTELGCKVIDALTGKFAFAELGYTREVEASLDLISEGKGVYKTVVAGVDNLLTLELGKLDAGNIGESHLCECGGQMRRKKGPKGFFWGCSNYPECKNTLPDEKGVPGQRRAPAAAATGPAHTCPKCSKTLVKRTARKGSNAGKDFWACSGWPACDFSASDADGVPALVK